MKKLTFSKSLFLIFEVKYIKSFSLEHILKSAGEVSIVENYGKICLVGLKIVCCPQAAMVKKMVKFWKNNFKHCSELLPKTNFKIFFYKSVV
jgi:hypothetical protein